ncbi:MAG: DJ-1/PfpI family protein [Candidatus Thorarchaeota archaeon]
MRGGIRKISLIFLICSMLLIGTVKIQVKSTNEEVKILCFIENGFGESYYINKDFLESYNYSIITASTSGYVYGCNNFGKDVPDTYPDILVSSISDNDILTYDCIFIPSGGHWGTVITRSRILEIIQIAHEEGILLAGICTGMIVLAYADVLEDVNVAKNDHALSYLLNAGANITNDDVVYDQGIITGGWGGGVGNGAENAPNEDFCEMIKEAIENPSEKTSINFSVISLAAIACFTVFTFIHKRRR